MRAKTQGMFISVALVLLAILIGVLGLTVLLTTSVVFGLMILVGALPVWGLSCFATELYNS